jgi:hypothetical protein
LQALAGDDSQLPRIPEQQLADAVVLFFSTDDTLPHKKARKILGLSSGTKGEKNELLHTD